MKSYFRDTLLVLSSVEDRPGDAAGIFSLEKERFGLAILEPEDLAVTADVEFALFKEIVSQMVPLRYAAFPAFLPHSPNPDKCAKGYNRTMER